MNKPLRSVKSMTFISAVLLAISACNDDDDVVKQLPSDEESALITHPQPVPANKIMADVKLRVMETTDLHANIMNYNYYQDRSDDSVGLVKTASLITAARAEVQNSVLVDNGDLIQGSPLSDYFAKVKGLETNAVHPIYQAMNLLDYDVANIGNHEFNYGLGFLQRAKRDANFPYICANVFIDDQDDDDSNDIAFFTPYIIIDKTVIDNAGLSHSLKIGYIGFVPPQIMQWDKSNLEGIVKAKDIVDMAEYYVPKMQAEGADIIIAIPHSGLVADVRKGGEENASYYLSQVEGIDAILFGHAHRNFPGDSSYDTLAGVDNEKGLINGTAAVMPGYWGKYLGFIDLHLQKYADNSWHVKDSQSVLRAISQQNPDRTITSLVASHAGIIEAVEDEHDEVQAWVSKPFAKISAPINSFFALVQDDPSIQVVTDAQSWYVTSITQGTEYAALPILSVGAPFRAGRGGADDFTDLSMGDVSYGNVADLYIYPNTLKVLQLNGAEIKEWLEMSAGQFNQIIPGGIDQSLINKDFPSYNFDVIDGISYQIDVSQPARYNKGGELINADAQRIIELHYQGQAINPEQDFLVVSNNYRASGGGNFPGITSDKVVIDAPNENRQTVADYLIYMTQENPQNGFDPSADGNWQFSPLAGTVVTFAGSSKDSAQSFANSLNNIDYSHQDDDGYGIYQLTL